MRIFIIFIITVFCGCSASKVEYVENDKLPKDDNFDILLVITVRKEVINMKNKSAKFQKNYLSKGSAIVYFENKTEKFIPLSEIEKIKIEIYNDRGSIAVAFGGLLLMGFLIYFINLDKGD